MNTVSPFHAPTAVPRHRIGLLSTYPPKLCGLATFAAALEGELQRSGHRVDVVRIDDGDGTPITAKPLAGELVNGRPSSIRAAATVLSNCDVAIVQHEYGIYGGEDGEEVLDLLKMISVPIIVVLHTVPVRPTVRQRSVLVAVAALADRVVVMTDSARNRLVATYPMDVSKIDTIPHGASTVTVVPVHDAHHSVRSSPQLLTWGLLGPGKGIEHTIDALALLGDMHPRPRYTIAGVTHPKVFTRDGDAYRHDLIRRSWANGVAATVVFDDTYRTVEELTRFVASSAVVVLPYDSREQVTSGVLVDAIAAGRPVIATAFPHALELLSSGAGIVVPHGDPPALADAIRSALTDHERMADMESEARRLATSLSWSAVAQQYSEVVTELVDTSDRLAV